MKTQRRQTRTKACLLIVALMCLCTMGLAKSKKLPVEPDLTKGEKLGRNFSTWTLGSTGATGNIWTARRHGTSLSRMIQVKEVAKGTPAAGLLLEGDVILGAHGQKFDTDAAKAYAAAISEAGKNGKLVLSVWRKGKTMPVTISVPALGTYSNTAPWNCAKTDKIVTAAADAIVKRGIASGIPGTIEALGLLATGDKQYHDALKAYAKTVAVDRQSKTFQIAYKNLFLTEYYLATNDKTVLPAIKVYASIIAGRCNDAGIWNRCSLDNLTCALSLILAQKCGVTIPGIDTRLKQFGDYMSWFVDKGGVPFGDLPPNPGIIASNGSNALAAVVLDLMGDKPSAQYFTSIATASYNQRDGSDNGKFFNWLWGALAAARGGDEAAQAFFAKTSWYQDMKRLPDGSFGFQPGSDRLYSQLPDKWSNTGVNLLHHCLSRKALCITGKGGGVTDPIKGKQLQDTVAAANTAPGKESSLDELLTLLGSWVPARRLAAAKELGNREEDAVARLIAMLKGTDRYARYGACQALHFAGRGSADAAAALIETARKTDDITLQFYAVDALKPGKGKTGLGGAARKGIPLMLELAAAPDLKKDPLRRLQTELAYFLFYTGRTRGQKGYLIDNKVSGVDRKVLIPMLKSMLTNPDQNARSLAAGPITHLKETELEPLWNNIYHCAKKEAPMGMFSPSQAAGIRIMAKFHVKEGIPLGLKMMDENSASWEMGHCLSSMKNYGQALTPHQPKIKELIKSFGEQNPNNKHVQGHLPDYYKLLEEAEKIPVGELKSIAKYVKDRPTN